MLSFKTSAVLVIVSTLASFTVANPLFDNSVEPDTEDYEDNEGRIFFSSNGGISFTNSTFDLAALLTAGLLGLLILLTLGGGLYNSKGAGSGYGYGQQQSGYNSNNFHSRSDRPVNPADNNLASQMYQLAMAFKKYEVKDTECQLFVACEASQLQKDPSEAGSILSEIADGVRPIMRNIGKHGRKSVQAKDEYVVKLLDAFMYGEDLARKGDQRDACEAFREKCYNQNKKPTY